MFKPKPEERAKFIKIMSDPAYKRSLCLVYDSDIARYLGLPNNTIGRWKKKYLKTIKIAESNNFDVQSFLRENKEVIAKNLLRVIKESKSPKGVELALSQLGELTDKAQGNAGYTNADVMMDVDLFIQNARDKMQEAGVCPVCGAMRDEFKALLNGN